MFLWHIAESQQTTAAKESASCVSKYHKQIIHCPKGMLRAEQSNKLGGLYVLGFCQRLFFQHIFIKFFHSVTHKQFKLNMELSQSLVNNDTQYHFCMVIPYAPCPHTNHAQTPALKSCHKIKFSDISKKVTVTYNTISGERML